MRKTVAALLAGMSLFAILPATAVAQDAAEDDGGLSEIVVTAQKKSENLQDVPISVAAITGDMVADRAAVTLQGLQGAVPNVEIGTFSNTPNTAVFTIRGIGVIEPDPYAGNTVGIVSDGIPQYFSMGALLDLYDVDRIEILRGPQGTLFGANTTGGVVNVVNAQPKIGEFSGKANLGYGNYDHINAGAAINAPLGEKLALRVAVSHDRRDGYVTNVVDGSDMGKRNVSIFRAALKYEASSDFDITLSGEYARARNGAPIVVAGDLPGEAEFVPAGFRNQYQSPCQPGLRCKAPSKYFSANDGGTGGEVRDQSDMDNYRASAIINLRNTGIGDITSITGYREFKLFEFTDQDGTPVPLIDTRRQTKGWQFSQELRTDIDITDSINLLLGGFYMKTHYDHFQHLRINFAGGATYNTINNQDFTLGLPGLFQRNLQDQDNNSISAFAQTYIDLSDKLRLQAGIRYQHERTKMLASTETRLANATINFLTDVTAGVANPRAPGFTDFDGTNSSLFGAGLVAPALGSESWNNVGWKLGLDYKLTDDALLYGYYARGFKSGGFTGRIGIAQDLGPYDPEEVDTFEVGIKADWLNNTLRTNLSAFYTIYRDIQLAQIYFIGTGANLTQGNTIINAASSNIKGFEFEMVAAPSRRLNFNASIAYLSAKYDKFDFVEANGAITDLSGERLQNAPRWSGSVGLSYEFPIGSIEGRFATNLTFASEKLLTSIQDTPRARVQPQELLNANLDFKINGKVTLGVWGTNITDNRYINSVFDAPGTLGLVNYAPPRQYGVSAKVNF